MLEIDFAHIEFGLSIEYERLNSCYFDQRVKKDKLLVSLYGELNDVYRCSGLLLAKKRV